MRSSPVRPRPWREPLERVRPMLAAPESAPLRSEHLVYEPKYDGIRALVELTPDGRVRILSRRGNDKTSQFADLAGALGSLARKLRGTVVLDGEIVALDAAGEPTGFQRLQSRIHAVGPVRDRLARSQPVALVAFDILRDGGNDLRPLPLSTRRARLERVVGGSASGAIRLSEFVPVDGRALDEEARDEGWEGLIAKHLDSPYLSGRRSSWWRKLKIERRQTAVVGGVTAAALLVGVWEAGALEWIGHARITDVDRQRLAPRLRRRARKSSPFRVAPETSTPATWVRPELVVEVAFTEWTRAGMLRHARHVGLRDDVAPESVRREVAARPAADATRSSRPRRPRARSAPAPSHTAERSRTDELSRTAERMPLPAEARALLSQLQRIEEEGGGGVLELPGTRLRVTGLDRVFWPASRITKGELMRYYATVAGVLLPNVAERPLVMRLHPRGVGAPARYQQRAPAGTPPGVRVEKLPFDRVVPRRLIGGSLPALLYQAQIGAISQDPFFSRVGSIDFPDHAVLDLDPMPGVAFRRVLDVALWVRDELAALGAAAFPKTSGASGAHVYVPLAPRTPYAAARLFCQLVATSVAQRHPRVATVERSIHARGRRVYVDYLQNSRGKTLATAYSARATDFAGVSMPLAWRDVEAGVEPRDFDVRSSVRRIVTRDPWRALRESAGADLRQVVETRRRRSSR